MTTTRHKGQMLLRCEAELIRYYSLVNRGSEKSAAAAMECDLSACIFCPCTKSPQRPYAGGRVLNRSRPGKGLVAGGLGLHSWVGLSIWSACTGRVSSAVEQRFCKPKV